MKKTILHISLIMSIIYAAAVCLAVVLQKAFMKGQGIMEEGMPFIVPSAEMLACAVMTAVSVIFYVLLLRVWDDMRTHMETTALVVHSILIVLMPWIFNLGAVIQFRYYAYSIGVNGVTAYSVVSRMIAGCNPLLVFSMLLQVIYAGITLGGKKKLNENFKEN